jgi:hypothetical protein
MFTNPHISTQLASYRQGNLLAEAEQHRVAAQFGSRPRASRHLAPVGRGVLWALRGIAARRTVMPA